jgi:amino acid transporter
VFAAYTSVLGFGGPDKLAASAAPITDLAHSSGLGDFSYVVDLGVAASFFAVAIASINAASRVLYTMGEEDLLPRALGRAHPKHKTPHVAIGVIAPIIGIVPVVMLLTDVTPLNVYAYTGTIGTFGYMLAYFLMALALPFFLRKRDEGSPLAIVLSIVVMAALAYVFYKNVVPVPDYPYNLFPWIFLGLLVAGLAVYAVMRVRRPQLVEEAGTYEEDPVPEGSLPVPLGHAGHPGHGGGHVSGPAEGGSENAVPDREPLG